MSCDDGFGWQCMIWQNRLQCCHVNQQFLRIFPDYFVPQIQKIKSSEEQFGFLKIQMNTQQNLWLMDVVRDDKEVARKNDIASTNLSYRYKKQIETSAYSTSDGLAFLKISRKNSSPIRSQKLKESATSRYRKVQYLQPFIPHSHQIHATNIKPFRLWSWRDYKSYKYCAQ